MYYELDVIDDPKWINCIVRTANTDDVTILEVDFNPKYLGHLIGIHDEIGFREIYIPILKTSETIHCENDGKCEIQIRCNHSVRLMTEQGKYSLTIVLISSVSDEHIVYEKNE